MTQHTDDAIDLPDPPLQTTTAEGSLKEAEVIAHRLQGGKVRGKLQSLSVSRQLLSIRQEPNPQPLNIAFADLRHLIFTRKLPLTTAAEQVAPSLSVDQDTQTFRVVLSTARSCRATREDILSTGADSIFFRSSTQAPLPEFLFPIKTSRSITSAHCSVKHWFRIGPNSKSMSTRHWRYSRNFARKKSASTCSTTGRSIPNS